MNPELERDVVLRPIYQQAKHNYELRHSKEAAKALRDAATYMLKNDLKMRQEAGHG